MVLFSLADSAATSAASSLSSPPARTCITINHAYPRWPVPDSVHRSEGYARLRHARRALRLGRLCEVYQHVLALPASFRCLHLSLVLVQCSVSNTLAAPPLTSLIRTTMDTFLIPQESSTSTLHSLCVYTPKQTPFFSIQSNFVVPRRRGTILDSHFTELSAMPPQPSVQSTSRPRPRPVREETFVYCCRCLNGPALLKINPSCPVCNVRHCRNCTYEKR